MAEESDGTSSLRNLPSGKMKNILQMFEAEDHSSQKEVTPLLRKARPLPGSRPLTSIIPAHDDSSKDDQIKNSTEKKRPTSEVVNRTPKRRPKKPSIVSETIKQLEDETFTGNSEELKTKDGGDSEIRKPTKQIIVKEVENGDIVPENHESRSSDNTSVTKQNQNFEIKPSYSLYAKPQLPQKPKMKSKSENVVESKRSDIATGSELDYQYPISPPPPKKPPRTHAHEECLMTNIKKTENKNIEQKQKDGKKMGGEFEDLNTQCQKPSTESDLKKRPAATYKRIEISKKKEDLQKLRSELDSSVTVSSVTIRHGREFGNRPDKPNRPPPPRPRPFSVATDTFKMKPSLLTEYQLQDKRCRPQRPMMPPQKYSDGPFYEQIAPIGNTKNDTEKKHNFSGTEDLVIDHRAESLEFDQDEIQHWDLPRDRLRFSLKRSLSAECVYAESTMPGDPIYIDPTEELGYHDDSEVYIDSAGYAVPYKFRRAQHTNSYGVGCLSEEKGLKSRLGGLRRLFSNEPAEKPKTEPGTPKTNKKKIHLVKQKINQAFSALNKYVRVRRGSETQTDEDLDRADSTSSESDSFVDLAEIDMRVQYCSFVRKKTYASIKNTRKINTEIYPQLFDYALIVGLRPKSDSIELEPYVMYKFPEMASSNISVPHFCFPDAAEFNTAKYSSTSEFYSFVLTNFDGGRVFGYCKRIMPPDSTDRLPEVLCIISPIDAFSMFYTLLNEIEKRRLLAMDLAQETIAAAFGRPLPSPGKIVHIRTLNIAGEMETLFLKRSSDRRLENVNCECLPEILGVDKLIKVFSCILMERSVLFCANQLSTLSNTIQALVTLLYPFSWQHTYIPLLPCQMLDVCCSPIPFIIGILSSHLPQVQALPLEDIVIVDLDKKQLLMSVGDEGTILPKKYQKALKTALNICKLDPDAQRSQNLMVSEAFLRFFVEAVSHFGDYFHIQQDGKKNFQKEVFSQAVSSNSLRQFLRWFVETQMFEVFTTDFSEQTAIDAMELFEMRISEYRELVAERKSGGFGQKMKNLGKAIKTKLA